ncbi:Protein N-acetyltransferase, RimJ/RimL family [Seinonella peptonophila]|uniref:Protein N-acetyltransferase, RimJ/RimL family n=1 Tax=Seinonella peptonophila TaxID=112248 RepID=A0A1M5B609_9BACL|nr:GNAT family protein [Seinonella peptonophila]SHF37717.1 Protein N-acetyltransferase, RimJ/RimL family [Seinonella peptonophila]
MVDNLIAKRLFLREFVESDWKDVHKYASQSVVCKYQPWGPNTEEESKTFVEQAIVDSKANPRSRYAFAIIENEKGSLIGAAEINIRDFKNKNGELAYIVHPDYWGMGFATEAAKLFIDFGFSELNLHRIFATCDPRNIASSKVLVKIGMSKEGRMRENVFIKGGWRDSLLFGILKREWKRN